MIQPGHIWKLLRFLLHGLLGAALTLLFVAVIYLDSRADLDLWHTADLDEEFTENSPVGSFEEYLELEQRLFTQLDALVYEETGESGADRINRYQRGSLSDPERWSPNWNRSFRLKASHSSASVVLLHGLSDSPYSLRNLGERLKEAGADVLGLRIPGHGTAPSGLLDVTWQDMAAAVRLAVRHMAQQNPGQPLYLVGYSNGAALAVHYSLESLSDESLPRVKRIVLISPEIGVTPVAALAIWQARLGRLLGLDKLLWNAILPEYDPFKYGSFAVNAGDVSHRLTAEIQSQLTRLGDAGKLGQVPPILAFSSAVDATVSVTALVENLFNRLQSEGNELVLFDINDVPDIQTLLKWDPQSVISALKKSDRAAYSLTVISNRDQANGELFEYHLSPGSNTQIKTRLDMLWPPEIYSLTHVSLPFPIQDPLYGDDPEQQSPGISLGHIALRGERGVLSVPASEMLRLRWNPFYPYIEVRTLQFLGLNE